MAHGNLAATGVYTTVYTCPQGKTAIVKDLRSGNDGSVQAFIIWSVLSGPVRTRLILTVANAGDTSFAAGLFVVLEPGDQLQLRIDASNVSYHVSGAELDGLAP